MKKNKNGCDLESCFLCTRCLPEWKPAIAGHRESYHVRKGESIFREGDPVQGVYFICNGSIKIHKQWGDEKELILRIAGKGDLIGHRGLQHEHAYAISATALEPVNLCFIGLDFFRTTLRLNEEFGYQLLRFVTGELQESERKMRNLAHMQVKGRIARALMELREKFGLTQEGYIDIALSRQDLASFAGTTYETVFRIINELVQDGMIRAEGKNITLLNEKGLMNNAREAD